MKTLKRENHTNMDEKCQEMKVVKSREVRRRMRKEGSNKEEVRKE